MDIKAGCGCSWLAGISWFFRRGVTKHTLYFIASSYTWDVEINLRGRMPLCSNVIVVASWVWVWASNIFSIERMLSTSPWLCWQCMYIIVVFFLFPGLLVRLAFSSVTQPMPFLVNTSQQCKPIFQGVCVLGEGESVQVCVCLLVFACVHVYTCVLVCVVCVVSSQTKYKSSKSF